MTPPDPQPYQTTGPAESTGSAQTHPAPVPVPPPVYRWYHKMSAVVFIVFCMEIGLYLLVYPWTEAWDGNYFSNLIPQLRDYWDNMYLRGAISGLGVINVYVSLVEIFRLRRFARR